MTKIAPEITPQIYQIKITLRGTKPPVWRRIQAPGDITLAKLHQILQVVMGWWNEHLHAFRVHGVDYGEPDPMLDMRSDKRVRLDQLLLEETSKFRYEYDFGDSWEHELLVEKILGPEAGVTYPRCLKGKRACPPEDVGGVWRYAWFLEAIADPEHPAHDELLDWVGGEFDPELFDLEAINTALSVLR
jgi:hypothetical protein